METGRTGRFSAARRIRKRWEFQRIQSRGRRVTTPHFVMLLFAPEPSELANVLPRQGSRLGITASRRIGSAVVRNRAKRLIREAFRRTPELWPADIDLVIIVKRPLERLKTGQVIEEWRAAQSRISRGSAEARKDRARRESELAERR